MVSVVQTFFFVFIFFSSSGYSNTPPYSFSYQESIGGFGSSKGLFNSPSGITGDTQYLFVCDTGNNRVVKIHPLLKTFDSFEILPDPLYPLDHPQGILLYQGNTVIVSDTRNHRLVFYSYNGIYRAQFGVLGIGVGEFDEPKGLAQSASGDLLVADGSNHRLVLFSSAMVRSINSQKTPDLSFLSMIEDTHLDRPSDCWITKTGDFLVTNTRTHSIYLLNRVNLVVQALFQTDGVTSNLFLEPTTIYQDEGGHFYVADSGHHRVLYLNRDGVILGQMDAPLKYPSGIFIMGNMVYVVDKGLHQIVIYKREKK